MASYNKVILVGNLTRDPQMSYLPSQTPVTEFGLAVNEKYKDKSGQQREDVLFIDVKAFGKPAETLNQYVNKGDPLLVEGKLKTDTWEKDGQKRSKTYVVVSGFQFLGGKKSATPSTNAAPSVRDAFPADEPPTGENIPY